MDAGQGEVEWIVSSQVLPWDDMFDVVRRLGVLLRMEAVFATIAGPPAYKLASGRVHQFPGCVRRKRRAFSLMRLRISAPST